jgi:UDPglucose 6-dehydrogenase/GDP-mannose 6-dehydrogenase
MRESPAIPLARTLIEQGARVVGYDPIARDTARDALPAGVELAPTLEAALSDVDAAMLLTRWDGFRRVPDVLRPDGRAPVLIDGRRMLDPGSTARYEGIGR